MSRIWKNILSLKNVTRKGRKIKFERIFGSALGSTAFKALFPRLFNLSTNKQGLIMELGCWSSGSWSRNIGWRRPLFGRELDEEGRLKVVIREISPRGSFQDRRTWSL
ncbi:hypothetical protein SLE2022_371510 [Rubroshorea leprosula]